MEYDIADDSAFIQTQPRCGCQVTVRADRIQTYNPPNGPALSSGLGTVTGHPTIETVKQRQAFGGRLFDKDVVRMKLAQAQTQVDAARNYLYYVAWLDAQGADCIKEVSGLKAWACEVANQVMYECVQLHGGMGFMEESVIERMYRDARVLTIGGGATEVMYSEVAKRL